jgi:uncharacterized protein YkwD
VHPDDRPDGWRGRHRYPRRAFGPLGLAIVVAVILGGFGAGAAFLPAGFVGRPGDSRAAVGGLAGGASTETDGAQQAPAAREIMRTAPSAGPTRSVTARPKPRPKATGTSPTPRRSPTAGGATTGAGGATTGGTQQAQVVVLVNRQRAAGGCGPLAVNAKLTVAAQLHSEDQAAHNTMSHTGSDGSSPWDRTKRAGYPNAIAENVAAGYPDAEAVMQGWMNSPGHRANIMNCAARAIGVGYAKAAGGTPYWTQDFGSTA